MKRKSMPKNDEFAREFTIRICSTLAIQTALENVFQYLKDIMPVDLLILGERDEHLNSLRLVAHVTIDGTMTPLPIVAVPRNLWAKLQSTDWRSPFLINDSDDLARQLGRIGNLQGYSHLCIPLWRNNKNVGFLSVVSKTPNLYNQAHVDLFRAVTEPTTIALSNALVHEELMRYRDTLIDENLFLSKELLDSSKVDIIGTKGGLKHVIELIKQVAPLNNTVLLLGETGTGKEVIANAIHFTSPRKNGPFIKVNCGAIPENLIDSELFGHEKGAFTGAAGEKKGRFERANGGTIFLDEIGELPQQAQVRLLRVVQNREIERVGGTRPIPVDIRIIAATHRNLESMVSENKFREDLWFRLNVFPLIIPPLRQRREDIPNLTNYFLGLKCRELGLRKPPPLAPGVLARLADYSWPGNVRELENLVERELIRYQGGALSFNTLVPNTFAAVAASPNANLPTNLDEVIFNHITTVLQRTGGRISGPSGAAVLLGLKGSTLRAKMEKLGVCHRRRK